ncbi:MAG: hypothetical protein IKA08_00975 [Alphaproteobacteria bacterium]|nr:hypothetical protein [Alphaproteobacteria bacterium]
MAGRSFNDILYPEFNDIFENTKKPRNRRAPLIRADAEFILGEPLSNVVIYDFINKRIDKSIYNGHCIVGGRLVTERAPKIKELCAKSSVIAGRVPVAVVAKTYEPEYGMRYSSLGDYVAGNIIFYNPKTKKYSAFTRGWMPFCEHLCRFAAAEQALYDVMDGISRNFTRVESYAYQEENTTHQSARKTFWNAITDFVGKNFSR